MIERAPAESEFADNAVLPAAHLRDIEDPG
jgi:hypothetical protein